ncbi:MAG: hypothetical protein EOO14_21015, partial [Chitinophagaceae bacterium]
MSLFRNLIMHIRNQVGGRRLHLFLTLFFALTFWGQVSGQGLQTEQTLEGIKVKEDGKEVLFYQVKPKSVAGKYQRSGYVHPLYGLNGELFTEDAPADHPYHRGVFWAWHQVLLNGNNSADGWVSENISWEVVKVSTRKNKGKARINAVVHWNWFDSATASTKTILKETTSITIHKANEQYRQIDFNIHLLPLVDSVALGGSADEKGYGGFCVRLKLPDDIVFSSASGAITPVETAVEAAPWMRFSGTFDTTGKNKSSLVVLNTGKDAGKQQKWILRKKKSMQNIVYPGNVAQVLPREGWKLA